jgi:hypothetical protein
MPVRVSSLSGARKKRTFPSKTFARGLKVHENFQAALTSKRAFASEESQPHASQDHGGCEQQSH